MRTGLRDRDPVEAGVDLAVAGAAQSVPISVPGPDRQRCGAAWPGVGVLGLEAVHVRGLADELRGGEQADAVHRQQCWCHERDQCIELPLDIPDLLGELRASGDHQIQRASCERAAKTRYANRRQRPSDAVVRVRPDMRVGYDLKCR